MPLSSRAAAAWVLLLCVCALPLIEIQALSPLKPPKTITASLTSAYGDVTCENQQVVVPTSTAEVAAAVRYYYSMQPASAGGPAATGGTPVKIRVVSRARGFNASDGYRQMGFHERAGFACAKGSQPGTGAVSLLMVNMRKVLSRSGATVRMQAGITLTEILRYATSQNLTVPFGAMPQYGDLTLGGTLATGAHGLGGRSNANMADIVRAITFVDGTGNITRVSRNSNVGRGLVGGLGMLGVITEVTLQLKPGSGKTRSWSPGLRSDANFAQELLQLWEKYSHISVYWRPDLKQYKATVVEGVPLSSPLHPPPVNASLPPTGGLFHPQSESTVSTAGQLIAALHSDKDSTGLFCRAFGSFLFNSESFGWVYGYKQGAGGAITPFTADNGTGFTNDMQTSECDIPGSPPGSGSCFYNPAVWERIWAKEKAAGSSRLTPSISLEEIEFALEATSLPSFIADFKLMAANMKTDVPGGCWPGGMMVLRTGFRTRDHISPQTGSAAERVMWVELGVFRPNVPLNAQQQSLKPRQQKRGAAVQQYFEQLLVCKYKARPHWGKGWSRVFTSTACPIKDLYPASNWATQLSLQQQYDPAKLFETQLLSSVLMGGAANPGGAACTSEMSCYCNADEDCGAAGLCCKAAPAVLPAVKSKLCLPC